MKKFFTALCLLGCFAAPAQTLFTYGSHPVSADEFLRAFEKNNNGGKDEKALREYLDLYIASRLKIAEAREKKLDTLPQLKTDLAALRQQILPSYLNDKESLDRLIKEAFERQQKDLHVAHIFIAFTKNGVTDSAAAKTRCDQLLAQLSKGLAFDEAAHRFSDDPAAQQNGGDIGWITAFTLPYEFETFVYNTPAGRTSPVYTSAAGYHLFKVLGERKALGRMNAAQILLAFPPGADDAYKARVKKTADSLYNRLLAGDDFGKLATAFSNDVVSAAANGRMQEFGVGEYSQAFENTVFGLPKNEAISKPFLTEHGYHIVKRLNLVPVPAKLDAAATDALRSKIEAADRMQVTKAALAQKILARTGIKNLLPSNAELWMFTDSAFNYTRPASRVNINPLTPVLKLADHSYNAMNWLTFAQVHRYRANGGVKTYPQVWNEFVQAMALQYYEEHLEEYNDEFRRQLHEFADGNLFFEIMQQKIWSPAQTDTAALQAYYNAHKGGYIWKQSADAVLFYAGNPTVADAFYTALRKSPADWKTILPNYAEQVTSDSGRFELEQLPKTETDKPAAGTLTSPLTNKADNTVSFAYVLRLHPAGEPRSFADARGLVINDYQAQLEKAWLAELKKKYPVTVNAATWKAVVKKATTRAS